MRSAPVAAEVAFQHKCVHCAQLVQGELAPHICTACGMPQPVSVSEDYFSAFGIPRRFGVDRQELEKRFYRISRALHPDRFTGAGVEANHLSLKRMSFLNQAYGSLKDRARLREYLLECEGIVGEKPSIPAELAESWFEIQDLLMEDPEVAVRKLADFEGELNRLKEATERRLCSLEKEYDLQPAHHLLEKLAKELQSQSYLKSIEKDVERIKKNAYSN